MRDVEGLTYLQNTKKYGRHGNITQTSEMHITLSVLPQPSQSLPPSHPQLAKERELTRKEIIGEFSL